MLPTSLMTRAAYGMHFADQIALVCVPLVAALVFNASPEVIGILVACQSSAYLFGSIPFGVMIDNMQLRTLTIAATLVTVLGFSGAGFSVMASSLFGFGAAITLAGFGIVLFVLTALSIISNSVKPDKLAEANARIELPRAIASFAVPLLVGFLIARGNTHLILLAGAAGGLWAVWAVTRLPHFDISPAAKESIWRKIVTGGNFVAGHPLLLPIAICAVFWNFAFSALLVVMVPLIRDVYLAGPGIFGSALASFGLGAIAGTWLLRRYAGRFVPGLILVFGPAVSFVAVVGLYLLEPAAGYIGICIGFSLLGFGPSMWMITQNSIRQTVTPAHMLGCVNATIQTTIYGIRPLGALAGGAVVGGFSPREGLLLVALIYAASLIAVVFSGLRSIRSYTELRALR